MQSNLEASQHALFGIIFDLRQLLFFGQARLFGIVLIRLRQRAVCPPSEPSMEPSPSCVQHQIQWMQPALNFQLINQIIEGKHSEIRVNACFFKFRQQIRKLSNSVNNPALRSHRARRDRPVPLRGVIALRVSAAESPLALPAAPSPQNPRRLPVPHRSIFPPSGSRLATVSLASLQRPRISPGKGAHHAIQNTGLCL